MEEDWIYYNIYPKSGALLDAVVEHIISAALEAVKENGGILRWFFIRYQDYSGAHIRLRILVKLEQITEIMDILEKIISEKLLLTDQVEGVGARRLIPLNKNSAFIQEQDSRLELAIYEPEIEKYGGEVGHAIAEEWFQDSSDICLRLAPKINNNSLNRFVIGLKFMDEILNLSQFKQEKRIDFIDYYLSYWSGVRFSSTGTKYKASIMNSAAKRRDLTMKLLQNTIDTNVMNEYRQSIKKVLIKLNENNLFDKWNDLLFHYIHMTNNRLGIWPIEEAYLAALLKDVYENNAIQYVNQ